MSFLFLGFLWTLSFLSIPIIIALWNRKKFRKEKFGAFFLLKKISETTTRRIRILEILRLINRLLLLTCLIFLFAEPYEWRKMIGEAENGFAILIDVGRSLQSVATVQKSKVIDTLRKLPVQSQGTIAFVSSRCDIASLKDGQQTARPEDWIDFLESNPWPYANRQTLASSLQLCFSHLETLYSGKSIYKTFISPLPDTLDKNQMEEMDLDIQKIDVPEIPKREDVDLRQEPQGASLRIFLKSNQKLKASLIVGGKKEPLGEIHDSLDLVPLEESFLLLEGSISTDPWAHQYLFPLKAQIAQQVTLWAQKESPGYLSLLSALRNHPNLKVVKQVGGNPQGEAIIIYGSYTMSDEILGRSFFLVDPEGQSPWPIRDKKQITAASLTSPDLLKSFRFSSPQGVVTIRRYVLLDPDRFETLASFDDGAPSLLKDRKSQARHWILPFDLEDLTTDLSLEPAFIPYLYTHLDAWLGSQDEVSADEELKPLWLMPGLTPPSTRVVERLEWPGIYSSQNRFKIVQPENFPKAFLNLRSKAQSTAEKEEKFFLRDLIEKILIASLFLELILSLFLGARLPRKTIKVFSFLFGLLLFVSESASALSVRPIAIGFLKGADRDRVEALAQIVRDADRLSNLDFDKPQEVSPPDFWKYPIVLISSARSFGPFSNQERQQIRDYCERGGFLFFDDPLATADSTFYRSVKEELTKIFPGRDLKDISKEDVIFRTYYLLSEVSGRKLASPQLQGLSFDNRWIAIFSSNDLLGANLRTQQGDYALSVAPYGISQRVLAQRLLMNVLMYSVTTDYKDDAIHLPHILKRRVK